LDRVLEAPHASSLESVPFNKISAFTPFQLFYLLMVWGVTWIVVGILFPLLFFLVVIRQHLLPKLFDTRHLWELDASEYKECEGVCRDPSISEVWILPFFFIYRTFSLHEQTYNPIQLESIGSFFLLK
jgi:hypothetical protein